MRLQDVCKLAWKHAKTKRDQGSVPTFLGLNGMLALMYDNIRRFHQGKEGPTYDEVLDLAANALFALEAVCETVLPGGTNEFENTVSICPPGEEIDDYGSPPPELLPQPPQYDGWNQDAAKAAELRTWLKKTEQWDLLTDDQRLGIEEAILEGEAVSYEETEEEEESEEEASE